MSIAFDSATHANYANSASRSFNHTCSGSDRILFVCTWRRSGSAVSGVTYNGVSMTSVGTEILAGTNSGNEYLQVWYLANPATGTNTVQVTSPTTTEHIDAAVSYTGASQTGIPDAVSSLASTVQLNSVGTLTTVADNCWALMFLRVDISGVATAGSGTVRRANVDGQTQVFDGNSPKTPAGSYSLNTTHTNNRVGWWMVSFAPVGGGGATPSRLMMMGIGI